MRASSSFFFHVMSAVVALAAIACGRSPASPSSPLTGTWRGTDVRAGVSRTITLEMTQSGAGVTGTWSAVADGLASPETGSLGGTLVGSTASLSLTPSSPVVCGPDVTLSGTLALTGTLAGDRLGGNYIVFLCDGAATGRIEVVRE